MADSFSSSGCYSQDDLESILTSKGAYTYQTPSYCETQCKGQKVAAVSDGKYCFCGSEVPDSSLEVDSSNCDTPCQGYGSISCGGDGYVQVYVNADVDGSTMQASSSTQTSSSSSSATKTSSTSSTQTSTSSSSSSTSSSSSSSSSGSSKGSVTSSGSSSSTETASGSYVTLFSTVTSGGSSSHSVVEVTTTIDANTSSSASAGSKTSGSSKSLSGGAIAGITVGSIGGVAVLAGLAFLFLYLRRKREDDDDEEFFDVGKRNSDFSNMAPHPYMGGAAGAGAVGKHEHNNSNTTRSYSTNNDDMLYGSHKNSDEFVDVPEEGFGRRRLSDGSLPDMLTRNPGSLQVVNN